MIVHWEHGRVVTAWLCIGSMGGWWLHDCALGAWEGGDCMIVHWCVNNPWICILSCSALQIQLVHAGFRTGFGDGEGNRILAWPYIVTYEMHPCLHQQSPDIPVLSVHPLLVELTKVQSWTRQDVCIQGLLTKAWIQCTEREWLKEGWVELTKVHGAKCLMLCQGIGIYEELEMLQIYDPVKICVAEWTEINHCPMFPCLWYCCDGHLIYNSGYNKNSWCVAVYMMIDITNKCLFNWWCL